MTTATVPERITATYLRTLPKLLVVGWAADVAEHVLDKFESKYPDDRRPREAIEATRHWCADVSGLAKARKAAYAAYAAADAAFAYAASASEEIRNKCAKFILKRIKA